MTRRRLALVILCATAAGFALGRTRRPEPVPSLAPGARVVVTRPTGELVRGRDGTGEPQAKTETVSLFVVKRRGEPALVPGPVWTLALGGTTYVLAAE